MNSQTYLSLSSEFHTYTIFKWTIQMKAQIFSPIM